MPNTPALLAPAAAPALPPPPPNQTRLAFLPGNQANGAMVEGPFFVNSRPARILFDTGASISVIASSFMHDSSIFPVELDIPYEISSPLGQKVILRQICRDCVVSLDDQRYLVDLVVLSLQSLDVIIGIDWMSRHGAVIDCAAKTVSLPGATEQEDRVVIAATSGNISIEKFLAY